MNSASCEKTSVKLSMLNNFPAIMLATAKPVSQTMVVIIFDVTSNIAEKKSLTTCPRSPIVLSIVPNAKQNTTIPIVFTPGRSVSSRTKIGFGFIELLSFDRA